MLFRVLLYEFESHYNSLLFQNIATFFLQNCYKRLVFAVAMHGRNQWLCVILALYLFKII